MLLLLLMLLYGVNQWLTYAVVDGDPRVILFLPSYHPVPMSYPTVPTVR